MAYQEGYINSLAGMTGTIGAFIALLVAIQLGANLPLMVMAISIPPVLSLAANGFRLLRKDRPWLRPRLAHADVSVALHLARIGFLFLVLQLAVAVAFQSDVLVAATILGPEAATTYAVTLRVFTFVPSLIGLYLITLWPAYSEALARRDLAWARQTLRRSIAIAAVVSALVSVMLLAFAGPIVGLLTSGTVQPPTELIIGAAILGSCKRRIQRRRHLSQCRFGHQIPGRGGVGNGDHQHYRLNRARECIRRQRDRLGHPARVHRLHRIADHHLPAPRIAQTGRRGKRFGMTTTGPQGEGFPFRPPTCQGTKKPMFAAMRSGVPGSRRPANTWTGSNAISPRPSGRAPLSRWPTGRWLCTSQCWPTGSDHPTKSSFHR